MGTIEWSVVCIALAVCASFLFISRRRLQVKLKSELQRLRNADLNTSEALRQASESKALFDLSQEENQDLKGRLDRSNALMNEKNVALVEGSASLKWASQSLQQKEDELTSVKTLLTFEQEQYKKLIGQKKSSEVRTGKIAEQISPFLSDYPFPPGNARFLGDPLDFVSFDDDKITFVEVKSGKSQLNKRQRHFRDLIKAGKVEFFLYRISGDG